MDTSGKTRARAEVAGDGPLLLGLLLTNQNNAQAGPIPDTLQLAEQSTYLEVRPTTGTDSVKDTDIVLPSTNVTTEVDGSLPHTALLAKTKLGLSPEDLQSWNRDGYLILEESLGADKALELTRSVHRLAERFFDGRDAARVCHFVGSDAPVSPNGRLIASLTEGTLLPDQWHLPALTDRSESAGPTLEPLARIRRIGTGVHRLLPNFRSVTFSARHQQIARSLGFRDPRVVQSLVVTKASRVGTKVVPHQDGCSSFTDPPSCVTFWYALEDATAENGCLMVKPGSHRTEPIKRRCRVNENGFPEFVPTETPLYADQKTAETLDPDVPLSADTLDGFKKLEVRAGTLVLMHGNLIHASEANRSSKGRLAYNFGVVEGSLPWLADNFLQPADGETEFEKLEPKI